MSEFAIRCRKCGEVLKDSYCAFCDHCPYALLVSEYQDRTFRTDAGEGIWRFNWLPIRKSGHGGAGPVVFPSQGLGEARA